MTEYSDSELIKLFKEGANPNYIFNLLMTKYQQRVYWHIRRLVIDHDDTNDLVQDVFVKVWKNLANFREDSKIFTWLYRIATNESITFLNKKKRRLFFSFNNLENQLTDKLSDDNFFKGTEIEKKLQQAIIKLPPKQRIVFNMKYFDEMKYEEMAEVLQTSVGALKASYHHAVKKIEEFVLNN